MGPNPPGTGFPGLWFALHIVYEMIGCRSYWSETLCCFRRFFQGDGVPKGRDPDHLPVFYDVSELTCGALSGSYRFWGKKRGPM